MGILGGRQHITVNGVDLADYGVFISGSGVYNAPERDVKSVSVPGRNGDLTLDNGRYKNVKIKYPAFVVDDFAQNVGGLRDFLASIRGYARLEDTYHPEEYRMGRVSGAFTVKPEDKLRGGKFDLTFDCMPQRWLKSGEERIVSWTAPEPGLVGTLLNPTMMTALPLLRVELSHASYALITIDGVTIKCTNPEGVLYAMCIDCELQEAYKALDGSNMNQYLELVDGVFPSFKAGTSEIFIRCNSSSGGVLGSLTVDITPRWWRL